VGGAGRGARVARWGARGPGAASRERGLTACHARSNRPRSPALLSRSRQSNAACRGQVEDALHLARPGHEDQAVPNAFGGVAQADEHAQAGRVHEVELAQVHDDVIAARVAQLSDLALQHVGGGEVKLAGQRHDDLIAVAHDADAELLNRLGGDGFHGRPL